MKGQLLEELAGIVLTPKAIKTKKGFKFIPGHEIRDAAGLQLTDGMLVLPLMN